jgi:preprotein translocase subunit YajC
MNLLTILLEEGEKGGGGMTTLLMYGAIIVIMYFFMLRPQIKKSKDARKFRENLQTGDHVITSGGIHGKVIEINENTILIGTEGQGKLKVEKASVNLSADATLQTGRR